MEYLEQAKKIGKGFIGGGIFAYGVYILAVWRDIKGLLVFFVCTLAFYLIVLGSNLKKKKETKPGSD